MATLYPDPLVKGDLVTGVPDGMGGFAVVKFVIEQNMPLGHGAFGFPPMLVAPQTIRIKRMSLSRIVVDARRGEAAGPKIHDSEEEIVAQIMYFDYERRRRMQFGNMPETMGRLNYMAQPAAGVGPRVFRATFVLQDDEVNSR